jgi:hypothetical protein
MTCAPKYTTLVTAKQRKFTQGHIAQFLIECHERVKTHALTVERY